MDADQAVTQRRWQRAAGIAFGLGTQALFALTAWQLFWYLRDGAEVQSSHWLLVDVLLALQFAVVHSLLLLPSVKSRITRWLPGSLYGSLFCVATCAGLWPIFLFWRVAPSSVWVVQGLPAMLLRTAYYGSWIALLYSIGLTGFGYQTGWTQWCSWYRRQRLPRREFVERSLYRWLRHPIYLSFLGLIWFAPHMTFDHAVLTGIWTGHIIVGSYLKDRRLEFYLGDTYRRYASRVPGYPGMFFGPLGKWKIPLTTQSSADKRAA